MKNQYLGLYKQLADGSAVLVTIIDESVCAYEGEQDGDGEEFRSPVAAAAFHAIVNLPGSEGCVGEIGKTPFFPASLSREYLRDSLRSAIAALSRN